MHLSIFLDPIVSEGHVVIDGLTLVALKPNHPFLRQSQLGRSPERYLRNRRHNGKLHFLGLLLPCRTDSQP